MEEQLRENNEPLFSLETRSPLREFNVIGFSLLYEMCYTNILTVLELSGIPFLASERGEDMPLIAAGGPCVCNPEPVAEIMDVMFFGDGEELVNDFMDVYAECRRRGLNKRDTLIELSKIEGVYVPAFYKAEYDENGNFSRIVKTEPSAPDRITRRIVRNLDAADAHADAGSARRDLFIARYANESRKRLLIMRTGSSAARAMTKSPCFRFQAEITPRFMQRFRRSLNGTQKSAFRFLSRVSA